MNIRINLIPRKTTRERVWKTLNVVVGITTILNVSMVGTLLQPTVAKAAEMPTQIETGTMDTTITPSATPSTSVNPALTTSCNLNVGLIVDTSGSINLTEMTSMKTALSSFTNAFALTPTDFSLTSFSTNATLQHGFSLTPSQTSADIANNAIIPAVGDGNTNWQAGLAVSAASFTAAQNKQHLIVIATDGSPNRYGNPVTNDFSYINALNPAIETANAIKTAGTRIVVVAIGDDESDPATIAEKQQKMENISGPNVATTTSAISTSTDVIKVADFTGLQAALTGYVNALCGGKITVQKQFDDGTTVSTSGTSVSGYDFTVNNGTTPVTQTTSTTGYLEFKNVAVGTYSVGETVKAGTYLKNVICTNGTANVGTADTANRQITGLPISDQGKIDCTFTNAPSTGTITVTKYDTTEHKLNGATFQICNGANCQSKTDGADGDVADGVVSFTGLATSQAGILYNVTETTAPTGYVKSNDTHAVTISYAQPTGTTSFVNVPAACGLTLTKTVKNLTHPNGPNQPGDTLEYRIDYKNIGNAVCRGGGVRIDDTVPTGLTYNGKHTESVDGGENLAENDPTNINAFPIQFGYPYDDLMNIGFPAANPAANITAGAKLLSWDTNNVSAGEYGHVTFQADIPTTIPECTTATYDNTAKGYAYELMPKVVSSNTVTTTLTTGCSGTLIVHKNVVNFQNGEVIDTNPFTVQVNGTNDKTVAENQDASYTLPAGTYTVAELIALAPNYQLVGYSVDNDPNLAGAQITVTNGHTTEVTITNKQKPSSISGMKFNDYNGNGIQDVGEPGIQGWTICMTLSSGGTAPVCTTTDSTGHYTFGNLLPISYDVMEQNVAGWTQTMPKTNAYVVSLGVNGQVTGKDFGNHRDTSSITVNKKVDNADGKGFVDVSGEATPFRWQLDLGATNLMGATLSTIVTGQHAVTEPTVNNYTFVGAYLNGATDRSEHAYSCSNPQFTVLPIPVTVANNGTTITLCNAHDTSHITFQKIVNNEEGADLSKFIFSTNSHDYKNGDQADIATGSYALTENTVSGYHFVGATGVCTINSNNQISLNANSKGGTCTIINARDTGTLKVIKHVDGGTAVAGNWKLHVKQGTTEIANSPQAGNESGTVYPLTVGQYTVSETDGPTGYTPTFSSSCPNGVITVIAGQAVTCTLTNTLTPVYFLKLTKGVDKTIAQPGDALTYTLTYSNTGNTPLTNVQVIESYDSRFSFGHSTPTPTTGNNVWTIGNLAVGASGTITITGTLPSIFPEGTTNVHNSAVVTADHVTVPPATADTKVTAACSLVVTKAVNTTSANGGDTLTYTIDYHNDGHAFCTGGGVKLYDTLGAGLTYVNNSAKLVSIANDQDLNDGDPAPEVFPATFNGSTVTLLGNLHEIGPGEHGIIQLQATTSTGTECTTWNVQNIGHTDGVEVGSDVAFSSPKTLVSAACSTTINVVKLVTNDNGGKKVAGDFAMHISGTAGTANFAGSTTGVTTNVVPGTFTVSETPDSGYTATMSGSCSGTITLGQHVVCTITNNDKPGSLVVKKNLINNNGGNTVVTDFSFKVNNGTSVSFEADAQNDITVNAGTYSIVENPAVGYSTTYDNCTNVVIPNGGTAICTITNDDIQPKITVIKTVVGGDKSVANFPLSVGTTSVTSGIQTGINAGTYVVSEVNNPAYGYSASVWGGDCASNGTITLHLGDMKTCTITNTRDTGTITVNKKVDNADGKGFVDVSGTATPFRWQLDLGDTNLMGTSLSNIVTGQHVVTESSVNNYSFVGAYINGTIDQSEHAYSCANPEFTTLPIPVTVTTAGASVTLCNTGIQPKLTVNKVVVGGTKVVSDFPLFVNTTKVTSSIQNGFNVGTYTISETNQANYSGVITGDCSATGAITLNVGDVKSCTITNTFTGKPSLSITKTNNIVGFTNPGQSVTYTVTVTNASSATDTARGVTLKDVLPAGFTYTTIGGVTRTFVLGDMAPGASIVTTYSADISTTQAIGTYTNTATAASTNATSVSATSNVDVRVPAVLGAMAIPTMTLTKTVLATTTNPGKTVTYTVTISNTSDIDVTNVTLSDTLPKGFTFVDTGKTTKSWTIGTLKANHQRIINYDVLVGSTVKAGTFVNKATVRSTELEPLNATAKVTVKVPQVLGLATTGASFRDYLIFASGLGCLAFGLFTAGRLRKRGVHGFAQ